jgi:hypothetical protein
MRIQHRRGDRTGKVGNKETKKERQKDRNRKGRKKKENEGSIHRTQLISLWIEEVNQ